MLPRTKARKRALDVLHAADALDGSVLEMLSAETSVPDFARELVEGVGATGPTPSLVRGRQFGIRVLARHVICLCARRWVGLHDLHYLYTHG